MIFLAVENLFVFSVDPYFPEAGFNLVGLSRTPRLRMDGCADHRDRCLYGTPFRLFALPETAGAICRGQTVFDISEYRIESLLLPVVSVVI